MPGSPFLRSNDKNSVATALDPKECVIERGLDSLPDNPTQPEHNEKELRVVLGAILSAIKRLRSQGKKMSHKELRYWVEEWYKIHAQLRNLLAFNKQAGKD